MGAYHPLLPPPLRSIRRKMRFVSGSGREGESVGFCVRCSGFGNRNWKCIRMNLGIARDCGGRLFLTVIMVQVECAPRSVGRTVSGLD
ncbi:hypothetical protein CDAR_59861 [Caerostris darwini]|uniref:Uncharacterized protein n=1 Tax=Caerostris darwini TaxID=1538125 RepID=A0AAV4RNF3_9ARAC|nr:hypothetical protein CDAR_59861 [Caerostris darwini]